MKMSTAHLVRESEARQIAWLGGSTHHITLDGQLTEGRLTLMRSVMVSGTAAPVHVHPDEDETLALLRGSAVVWAGADRWQMRAGDTVFLPRGLPHTYRVVEEADLFTVCTPSGMERFFDQAGWDLAAGPAPDSWHVTPAAMQDAARAGGQVVLGPPLEVADEMPHEFQSNQAEV
jgi:quercetin dioxygenase-like cupin family protein